MVASQVPQKAIAGDTLAWERDLAEYPAGTWTLSYRLSNAAGNIDITATADGTTHVVNLAPATTAGYTSGRYRWHARVTDGSAVHTVEDGWIEILPDPTGAGVDYRSHARKMLDAIEAILEGNATKNQLDLVSYSIGGELSLTRDRDKLLELREKYTLEVAGEEGVDRLRDRNLYIRFGVR